MADTVSTRTLFSSKKRLVIELLNQSDGTGESAVVKVDKSTLTALDGAEPSSITIEKIEWNCEGMVVALFWDHTSDVKAAVLNGHGCRDYNDVGGHHDTGSGETGDIILTTTGHTAGDSYMIRLDLRLEE